RRRRCGCDRLLQRRRSAADLAPHAPPRDRGLVRRTDAEINVMPEEEPISNQERLRARLRQLILMRETGPKRATWHAARARLIWRLHAEIQQEAHADPAAEIVREDADH